MTKAERDLIIETVDGEVAAIVTITGMGQDASPAIVDEIEHAITDNLGHRVRGR